MNTRLWNSFNLLAVILLAIGITGAISRGHMVFDPGRVPSGHEWIVYVVAGALMLVNGFLPAANPPDPKPAKGTESTDTPSASDTTSTD